MEQGYWETELVYKSPLIIIFDTNFLLLPIRFGIDVFDQLDILLDIAYEPTITKSVLKELDILKKGGQPSFIKEINFVLSNLSKYKIIDDDNSNNNGDVDSKLLRLAKENSYIVATTDNELRQRLRNEGIPVIYLRQKNHLALDGYIIN